MQPKSTALASHRWDSLRLLTVEDAARFLGLPETKIVALMKVGRFECIQLGRSWRVSMPSLMAYKATLVDDGDLVVAPDHFALTARVDELASDVARLTTIVNALAKPRLRRRSIRSIGQVKRLIERDGQHCRYCGKKTDRSSRVLDHLIAVALGGSDEDENLVVACRWCNGVKGHAFATDRGLVLRPSPKGSDELNARQQRMARGIMP